MLICWRHFFPRSVANLCLFLQKLLLKERLIIFLQMCIIPQFRTVIAIHNNAKTYHGFQ